jgi:ankyrin repeat protein
VSNDLLVAVQKRALKSVEKALATPGVDLEVRDDEGATPLCILCKSRSGAMSGTETTIALLLIRTGADVNAKTEDGATPLHLAAAAGGREVVTALIAKGATVTTDNYGNNPLHGCFSTTSRDTWMWDRLIGIGCDIEGRNESGDTVVHEAAVSWNLVGVKYLVDKGADVTAKNSDGRTVLDSARHYEQDKIIAYLEKLAGGAKPAAKPAAKAKPKRRA